MPAYNAARTLEQTFQEVPRDLVDEIVLTDDASQDDTVAWRAELGIRTLVHDRNRGYGGNQKTCYAEALRLGADVVVMLHPDYQYTPRLIAAMATLIIDGPFDVVLGSRILGGRARAGRHAALQVRREPLPHRERRTCCAARSSPSSTPATGPSRARCSRRCPLEENSDDFVFDNQMLAQAIYAGFEIGEISCPAAYFPEASSINFRRSVTYGIGVLETRAALLARAARLAPLAHLRARRAHLARGARGLSERPGARRRGAGLLARRAAAPRGGAGHPAPGRCARRPSGSRCSAPRAAGAAKARSAWCSSRSTRCAPTPVGCYGGGPGTTPRPRRPRRAGHALRAGLLAGAPHAALPHDAADGPRPAGARRPSQRRVRPLAPASRPSPRRSSARASRPPPSSSSFVLDRRFGLARGFDVYDDALGFGRSGRGGATRRRAERRPGRWTPRSPGSPMRRRASSSGSISTIPTPATGRREPYASRFASDRYDGEVAFADAQLGRLLEGLAARFPGEGTARRGDERSRREPRGARRADPLLHALRRHPARAADPRGPGRSRRADGDGAGASRRRRAHPPRPRRCAAAPRGRAARASFPSSPASRRRRGSPTSRPSRRSSTSAGARSSACARSATSIVRAPRPELYDVAADPARGAEPRRGRAGARARSSTRSSKRSSPAARRSRRTSSPAAEARAQLEALGYVVPEPGAAQGGDLAQVGGIDPKDAVSSVRLRNQANGLLGAGKPAEALARLAPLTDQGFETQLLRGSALLALGDSAGAREAARAMLAAAPARGGGSRPARRELRGRRQARGRASAPTARRTPSSPSPALRTRASAVWRRNAASAAAPPSSIAAPSRHGCPTPRPPGASPPSSSRKAPATRRAAASQTLPARELRAPTPRCASPRPSSAPAASSSPWYASTRGSAVRRTPCPCSRRRRRSSKSWGASTRRCRSASASSRPIPAAPPPRTPWPGTSRASAATSGVPAPSRGGGPRDARRPRRPRYARRGAPRARRSRGGPRRPRRRALPRRRREPEPAARTPRRGPRAPRAPRGRAARPREGTRRAASRGRLRRSRVARGGRARRERVADARN